MKLQWNALLEKWRDRPGSAGAAVVLGILAMVLILLSELWPSGTNTVVPAEVSGQDAAAYQTQLEQRLSGLIGEIEGAGQATVMITLESGEETIYALDTQSGQTQSQQTHVLLEDGTALEETVYFPAVCGVAVVCDGGGDVRVAARITELISALLDVPANRICVEQRSR